MDEATVAAILKWLDENPYEVFCDYDEALPGKVVQAIFEGSEDALWEYQQEVEDNAFHYIEWDDIKADLVRALGLSDEVAESEEFEELFEENRVISTDDYIKTAARHTRVHITAMPYIGAPGETHFEEDQEDCLFLFPHGYLSEEENARRAKQLGDVLGVEDPTAAETMYEFDALKVIGTLNVSALIEKGAPTHITLGPDDACLLVTHNRVNGSGGLGDVKPTKTVTLPAVFRIDDGDSYGVDSVFGFVGEVWRRELAASWEEIPEPVEA